MCLELVLRATYRFFHKMSQVVQMQSTDAKPAAVACFMASSIVMPLAVFGELRGLRVVSVRKIRDRLRKLPQNLRPTPRARILTHLTL